MVGHPKSVRVTEMAKDWPYQRYTKKLTKYTMRAGQNDDQVKVYRYTSAFL